MCALTSSRLGDFSDKVTYILPDNNIFLGGRWAFGLGEHLLVKYPRTLHWEGKVKN